MAAIRMKPQSCLKAKGTRCDTVVAGRVKPSPRFRKAIVVLAETSPGGFEAWVTVAGAMKSENTTGMLSLLCKSFG